MLQVVVAGNIGRVDEIKRIGKDSIVLKFSVAHNNPRDNSTTWVSVSVWGAYAEAIAKNIMKVKSVVVTGDGKLDEWTNPNGDYLAQIKVNAHTVEFTAWKQRDDNAPEPEQDEDIPF